MSSFVKSELRNLQQVVHQTLTYSTAVKRKHFVELHVYHDAVQAYLDRGIVQVKIKLAFREAKRCCLALRVL